MYKRILLAYDGTREGMIALREGALLAKRCGAHVFLLSILPESAGLMMGENTTSMLADQQLKTYKALLARGVEALTQLGMEPVAKLVVGEPALQIGAFAREVHADLVVLGQRKKSFLHRWWAGATGAYVTDHVKCSVLVGRNAISDEAFEAALHAGGQRHEDNVPAEKITKS